MSTTQENLDERIIRIKKRDEEIERKHRAAEEDRLLALKHNAMVKTKSPTDDDWPKGHKYDSLDFTYDQNEQLDDDKMSKKAEKDKCTPKRGREYKKFPDDSGPPPDPTYNFLKDAERDGVTEKVTVNNKKDWRQSSGGNSNARNKNGLNNSFRGRNAEQRTGNTSGSNRYPKHEEYGSWKNELDRIDESSIGRQKGGDGKWRREWDRDKNNDNDISKQLENAFVTNSRQLTNPMQLKQQQQQFHIMQNQPMPQLQQQHYQQQQQPLSPPSQQQPQFHFQSRPCNPFHIMRPIQPTQHLTETPMEKRGNIMVTLSQDGEIKSVKFQSTKAIGTGRVGQSRQNSKPQFSVQKDAFPILTQYQPDNAAYFVAAPVMSITPRRLGPSLQDRLNRHRQPQQQNNSFEPIHRLHHPKMLR